jgi:thiol-disulfide isomerase/thioredoxin
MFCVISFIVLAILGIFSASNRQLAKEAFDCVLHRVTFRPCTTGFDEKMKAKILGVVITRSERTARFLNRNFEPLAWIFFIVFLTAGIWSVRGLYLYYTTGSCNGLNQAGFCVFDPTGQSNQVSTGAQSCKISQFNGDGPSLKDVDLSLFPVNNPESANRIVFIGCYHCEYSRKTYPLIEKLVEQYNAQLVFLHYPVKETSDYSSRLGTCLYRENPDYLWRMNEFWFTSPITDSADPVLLENSLKEMWLDPKAVDACVNDPQTKTTVAQQLAAIEKSNFYGTPTVFIGDETLIGPKPYRVYAIALKGLFYWLR